jgi:23S rRNA (adenine2503-C2)-methyltransferase
MIPPANHIFEHTPASLSLWCESEGMPPYRAKQILEWVYERGVTNPAKMTNLSKADRDRVAAGLVMLSGRVVRHQRATDGTQKLLIQWEDDAALRDVDPEAPLDLRDASATAPQNASTALPILGQEAAGHEEEHGYRPGGTLDTTRQTECVMIPSDDRKTACISSQVGCPVGCKFCASGMGGLDANLSAGRIVEQVYRLARLAGVGRISNVVFMGMGEPLSNLGAVVPAIRTIASPDGMGISARKITVSTVGLPKAIENLSQQLDLPITLALSLHAPTDELRRELIPWAEFTTIKELLRACEGWFRKTGREVTLEYTLLRGVNDRPEHARQLATLARTMRANINLIRYNEVAGTAFQRPLTDDVLAFQKTLRDARVNSHIRASRGRDIAAACGQLRHEAAAKQV